VCTETQLYAFEPACYGSKSGSAGLLIWNQIFSGCIWFPACRLLRRALYLADLRDHQLDMVKEAKAQKTEVIKELTL
jgi:hypothetical protein